MAILKKSLGDTSRPVRLNIVATFPKPGTRKVTPADLTRASEAAAAAFRASLEGRTPAYDLVEVTYEMDYSYKVAGSKGSV